MKSIIIIFSFVAVALGQVTRPQGVDTESVYVATSTNGNDRSRGSATLSTSASQTAEQWPRYSKASTTETPSALASPIQSDAPFTFGDSPSFAPSLSDSPSGTDSWNSWSGSATSHPFSLVTTAKPTTLKSTSAVAVATHSAAYSTTAKPTSTKATSATQATYTGAGSFGKDVAFGFGAIAAGLAFVF